MVLCRILFSLLIYGGICICEDLELQVNVFLVQKLVNVEQRRERNLCKFINKRFINETTFSVGVIKHSKRIHFD